MNGNRTPMAGWTAQRPCANIKPNMKTLPVRSRASPLRGFTLIELMIAVAIVALLITVALPIYQDSIHKGRRSDAFAAVSAIQLAQERWRANNAAYATSLNDLAVTAPALYSFTISAPPAPATLSNGYVITATGTGSQASDSRCQSLGISIVGGNIQYAGCTGCGTLIYADHNSCWAR